MLHRSRDLLMRHRRMILKAIRANLAEFGMITAQGPRKVFDHVRRPSDPEGGLNLPALAWSAMLSLAAQFESLAAEIGKIGRLLLAWHRQNQASQRLQTNPGIGSITATALAASVPDPSVFRSGRQFAAWLALVPPENASVDKERLGRVSKMGNGELRRSPVGGATSVTRRAPTTDSRTGVFPAA